MTIYNQSTKSSTIIDARETAPSNATWDMFDTHSSTSGGLSVAVPGELKGYSYAYKKYGGGVPWSRLFVPAIEKARNGFAVSSEFATKLQEDKSSILKHSGLCDLYCNQARDEVKSEGEVVKNAKLADTLETVKNHGAEAFYTSPLVDAFVHDINFNGGEVSAADFANYKVKERTPLKVALANSGLTLIVPPLPSGGPILSIIMLVMDSYNINPQLFKSNNSLYWHRTVESFKHAFGHAAHFGDPDFARNANQAVTDTLSQSGILNITRKVLDDRTFTDTIYYGAAEHNSNTHTSSTSHLSVLSPDGDAVSVTSTINYHFGSFVFSSSTGVLFNNEMGDFTTPGMGANMVEAGKRPQSSMSPCVLVDSTTNEVVYIFGAAGGKHIPTAVAISLLELLYFGTSDFDEAIRQPRLHNQLFPDVINYEADFKESVLDDLRALGHNVADEPQGHRSSVNGIKNHGSHIHAFSDLRNKGSGASGW
uniref:Gamma-glutamyltransferase n=1 Tax=Ciona savignyi TaxID=51511 RepID=H2ZHA3_CIOSA